ncbi:GntR family transcriptional regulator [Bacillus sp. J33]|uniref:GntR family transcriptional regulator n=1 Tax=Bacillus sp. J33 TaxID=935836 RepID=UPI00047BEFEC|nr:GntR family transcriptional regulator [Bacillus sp. J33]
MSQKPLEKAPPFYLQIQQTIKERIWHGEYKPGDRLYETQLAKQFSISRSPVREAIRTLINEGLLIMDEKAQITVYKPTLKDVKDIYGCRISLESAAVSLAAERATESQIAELERILAGTETAIKQNDKEETVMWNTKFHEQIILISDNIRLKKLVDELHSLTYYYRLLNIEGNERGQTILNGHKEIVNAIRERDPEKAAQSLMEHTQEDLKNLIKLIEGKGEN